MITNQVDDLGNLKPRKITEVNSLNGYMLVLEYVLQDCSYLHVVQWHFLNSNLDEHGLPKVSCKVFLRDTNNALEFARKIGDELLNQNVN